MIPYILHFPVYLFPLFLTYLGSMWSLFYTAGGNAIYFGWSIRVYWPGVQAIREILLTTEPMKNTRLGTLVCRKYNRLVLW